VSGAAAERKTLAIVCVELAESAVEMDKRLSAPEGPMDGFLAAASAFGAGARRRAKLIEAAHKHRRGAPAWQGS
jgi:hypothetical protein